MKYCLKLIIFDIFCLQFVLFFLALMSIKRWNYHWIIMSCGANRSLKKPGFVLFKKSSCNNVVVFQN